MNEKLMQTLMQKLTPAEVDQLQGEFTVCSPSAIGRRSRKSSTVTAV